MEETEKLKMRFLQMQAATVPLAQMLQRTVAKLMAETMVVSAQMLN